MTAVLSTASLQAQRSMLNPIPHENLLFTFCDKGGATIGCGDVSIFHNIAILLKSCKHDEKFQATVNRFHIIVRTMRRSPHWGWVKPEHINIILAMCEEIYENIDRFVEMYKERQQTFLEVMEKSVDVGSLEEGDYLSLANGLKKPYAFITGAEFKDWMKGRSDCYKSLKGKMPKINLITLPELNEHDGKCFMITA